MSVSTANASSLIETQVLDMLVKPLQAASVVLAANPRIVDSAAPVLVPTITGNTSPEWVGENELIPEQDVNFNELTLMPTTRKSIKTLTRVSNELIRAATHGVSAMLEQKLVEDVRVKLDSALLAGDGAGDTVTGLMNTEGVLTGELDPANPDSVLDALALLSAAEHTPTHMFISGADFFNMRKLKDQGGRYLLEPNPANAAAYQLQGVPVTVTNKLPAGSAILADMSTVVVVRDLDAQVTIDTSRYLEFDQTAIRTVSRWDIGVVDPTGVIVLNKA